MEKIKKINKLSKKQDLLKDNRFLPLFITQFFGAFNDNAFKNAFLIWFTFCIVSYHGMDAAFMVNISTALFILPFFLFSATAGQLADKYEKACLTRKIKFIEIILMVLCAFCFYYNEVLGLLVILFAMGIQSTFFGPIKYSLLPDLLKSEELILANSYMEAGTFLSILLGTVAGGLIILTEFGIEIIGISLVLFSFIGYVASLFIPKTKIADENIVIGYNVWKETSQIIGFAKKNTHVWFCVLAISWFWFIGVTFLTQFPIYAKDVIQGNEELVTLFLAIFSIGIGIGSALCNRFSRGEINMKLVPMGGFGISVCIVIFYVASYVYSMEYYLDIDNMAENILMNKEIIHYKDIISFLDVGFCSYIIIISLLGVSIMSGVYIVPLYAFMQDKAEKSQISRIIAANNVINGIFMVFASLVAIMFYAFSFSVLELFMLIASINIIVSLIIKKIFKY